MSAFPNVTCNMFPFSFCTLPLEANLPVKLELVFLQTRSGCSPLCLCQIPEFLKYLNPYFEFANEFSFVFVSVFLCFVFCLDIFLCSSPNEALVQSNVSLPNSRIPPVSRSRLNLSLCFPLHPVLNVLAADCLNSDLDLCGRLSRLRQAVMKAIRRGVFQSMRPRLTKPRLSGSYQPLPPHQFPPSSCHLSSLFSPNPEWILLILSTLAFGGQALYWLALPPAPSISLIYDSAPPLSFVSHPEYTAPLHLRYIQICL